MKGRSVPSLEELVDSLRRASRDLKRVLGGKFVGLMLFGSHARGEASGESDEAGLGSVVRVVCKHYLRRCVLFDSLRRFGSCFFQLAGRCS